MAVISELIEAGLRLKQSGKLDGAIEHFKQLHATYPDHARIMFELAACWRAFGVPEQALPLYRELLARPKSQGLPPKDMPRLYTQLGATLLEMGESAESLAIIREGLRLHPSYRSLRAWRIFALAKAGAHQSALLDALELMLESLAPSRWDIFEADIKTVVKAMRENLPDDALIEAENFETSPATSRPEQAEGTSERAAAVKSEAASDAKTLAQRATINVTSETADKSETDVAVNLVKPTKKKKAGRQRKSRPQMGKKAVRIDISGETDEPAKKPDGDNAASDGALKIPIDPE